MLRRPLTPLQRFRPLQWTDALAPLPEFDHDLVHSMNAVPVLTRRPCIVTFEDYRPRVPEDRYVGWLERWLQRRLARDQYTALVAMSQYAVRQFRRQNGGLPDFARLEAKLHQIYPGVSLVQSTPRRSSGRLRVLFVGVDFMRKGVRRW